LATSVAKNQNVKNCLTFKKQQNHGQ